MSDICSKAILLLYFLVTLTSNISSQSNQNIRFTTINHTDGLPNNFINTITKDDLGFVWMGTNDGLCRYESANNVKVYQANDATIEGGLQSSNIRALLLDSKRNLWIGTRLGGLTKFHQPSDTWKTFRNDKMDSSSLTNDEILTIMEDSKGRIWVGTEDGLNVYIKETDSFISFKANNNRTGTLEGKAVLSIFEDDKGWIWVGTWEGGLNLLLPSADGNLANAQFRTFYPSEKKPGKRVWKIYQDKQKRYWLGTAMGGLFLMQLPSEESNNQLADLDWTPTFFNYVYDGAKNSITHDDIKDIFEDRRGNLWITTSNGLNCILAKDFTKPTSIQETTKPAFTFYHYFYDPTDLTSLTNNNVRTIFEDEQGIIWLGTGGGLSQYNWFTNQFEVHELAEDLTKISLFQNLYIDVDGVAWYGNGEKGILKYDFEKNEKTVLKLNGNERPIKFVTTLHSSDDKKLYAGTMDGVIVLEMKTKRTKYYPLIDEGKKQHKLTIRSIYNDAQNQIWVGTEEGLFIIDEKTGAYTTYTKDANNPKSISDNTINKIYKDSHGDIWLATFQGLNKVIPINPNKIEFEVFKHDATNPKTSIPSNKIVSVVEIDGILYIASNNGLSGFDLKKKFFTNYSKNHHKFSFQSIEKTLDGNIWASTTEGIVSFNTQSKIFNKYEKRDGLGDILFQLGASYVDKNGWLYFGSRRGITRFDPLEIGKNETPPPVYVTDIRKMSPERELYINGTYKQEIILEHDEYYLSLDYVGLNYNRSEKNQYAFMLEGFEDNWNYSDKKLPAVYTNLKYGAYKFRVKAANNDGIWNEVGTTLSIIKKPAFWETWWFKLGCLVFTIALLIIGVKFYTRSINKRNKILEKYNEDLNKEIAQRKVVETALQERELHLSASNEELQRSNKDLEQFAYIASHDLQEPLTVIGNFVGLLKHRYKQQFDEEAIQYIDFAINGVNRMSQQIRSILTFSKVSQKEIAFQLTNLNEVVATKLQDFSQNIEEKNVQFNIDKLPEIICEQHQLEIVFHNLISNAIKFNKSKTPLITISYNATSGKFWQFSVKDNGIGIPKAYQTKIFEIFKRLHSKQAYEGTGIGLALCQKIIHRHQGKIWVESKEGEGTTFYFTIFKHLKIEPTNIDFSKYREIEGISLVAQNQKGTVGK